MYDSYKAGERIVKKLLKYGTKIIERNPDVVLLADYLVRR
jgi:hypothetical protein